MPRPIINSFAMQSARIDAILPLAAEYGCDIVGLTMENSVPLKVADRLELALELVDAANDAGVRNDHILIDPVVLPLGMDHGQQHALAVREVVATLHQMFDPPVRSICGVSNVSNGAPGDLRSAINRVFLAMLGGAGLDVAILDVSDAEVMRSVRLIRAFRKQSMYSVSDAELQ